MKNLQLSLFPLSYEDELRQFCARMQTSVERLIKLGHYGW